MPQLRGNEPTLGLNKGMAWKGTERKCHGKEMQEKA
jgi:hypothetical protein